MPYNGAGVVSFGFPMDDFTFTYLISGLADDTAVAAAPGKAVSLDTAAANTVKLAADGDPIFGRVRTAENRAVLGFKTAAVARRFKEKLPAANGHGIVVGDRVVGAGNGLVKKDPSAAGSAALLSNPTHVIEVIGNDIVVERL